MVDIITEIGEDCRNADAVICTNDSGAIIRWNPACTAPTDRQPPKRAR